MWIFAALLTSSVPARADDGPQYLLGDLSVRLDLDKSRWHMTRWSNWDFHATVPAQGIDLEAWSTPVRAPVDPADPWGPVITAKVESFHAINPKVTSATVQKVGSR